MPKDTISNPIASFEAKPVFMPKTAARPNKLGRVSNIAIDAARKISPGIHHDINLLANAAIVEDAIHAAIQRDNNLMTLLKEYLKHPSADGSPARKELRILLQNHLDS